MLKTVCICLLALICSTGGARGEVYKCVGDDGISRFSDRPCGENAEVIVEKTDFTVDEAIGNGSPYDGPVVYTPYIGADVLLHACKVGKSLFPNKMLSLQDITTEHTAMQYVWKVNLQYVSRDNDYDKDRLVMDYVADRKDDKIFVRLHHIEMHRFDWMNPLPTLKNVQKMKRYGSFGWIVTP